MSRPKTPFSETMAAIRRHLIPLVAISCFVNILLLVTSIYMLQIYDRVLSSGSLDTLFWLTVLAVAAIVIYGLLEQSRRLILSRAAGFIDSQLSAEVLQNAMEQRLSGRKATATVRDVSDLRTFFQADAALSFLDAPWSLIFIAFVWLLHPGLGMIVLLGAIVLFFATVANDLLTRKRQQEAAQAVREANEAAIRFVEGGETIVPMGMSKAIFERWKAWQDRARDEQHDLGETTTSILNFTRSLRMVLQVAILGTGAFLVLEGQITAGAMIAASIIGARALAPIERLTAAWKKFVAARVAKSALRQSFEEMQRQPYSVTLPRPKGRLAVENLTVLAAGSAQPILRKVSFALEPGEICAVIGPSGAGKSSLCRAIVGAWRPATGCVRLDGADTYRWNPENLGPFLGYLPQKAELFPGTVAENIARFGNLDSGQILAAAKLAGADQLIRHLPDGYETDVGPNADRISMGQRQRIGLARALFGDPALVVLDEPNSNLDGAGDKALTEALRQMKRHGKTVVIVSHRADVLKDVDKVLMLYEGAVAKFCDRDEILKPVSQPGVPDRKQLNSGIRLSKAANVTPAE